MFLTLSGNCSSLVDHLIEQTPNWKSLSSISMNTFAYEQMKNDPYLKQNDSIWSREELVIDGKYYPSLSYEVKQISIDLWVIEWIEYDGSRHYFTKNPIGSAHITYNAAS